MCFTVTVKDSRNFNAIGQEGCSELKHDILTFKAT